MTEPTDEAVSEHEHWFAGKDLDVLLFKVNRRLMWRNTLFEESNREDQPADPIGHVQENLALFNPEAESGRATKRKWQVGNLELSADGSVLTGRLGWARTGQTLSNVYDPKTREWVDQEVPGDRSGVSPFALLREGRIVGILRHPTFSDRTTADVFTQLLNSAERQRPEPTTEFDVEPIGDTSEFYSWLEDVDKVSKVEFVFKRPNPDAEESFAELFERQEAYRADEIREIIKSANGDDRGLNKEAFHSDRNAKMFLAAAMAAYGYVLARGKRGSKQARFDQRAKVARESIENVGAAWEAATAEVVTATQRGSRRRRNDG